MQGPTTTKAAARQAKGPPMAVHFHEEDLGEGVTFADGPIAIDTEAMGLNPHRDRLCLVQLSDGKGDEHLVRFSPGSDYAAPRLKALLADPGRLKLYHFARFDIAIIQAYLGIMAAPLYCTRTASRIAPHLHRPPRPQGSGQGIDRPGFEQAAADQRLGRARTQRRAARLCRQRRPLPPSAQGRSSTSGSPAKAAPSWPRPVSISCRRAPGSTSPAGRTRISSRTTADPIFNE